MIAVSDMEALKTHIAMQIDSQHSQTDAPENLEFLAALAAVKQGKVDGVIKLSKRYDMLATGSDNRHTRISDLVKLGERHIERAQAMQTQGQASRWRHEVLASYYGMIERVIDYALDSDVVEDDLGPAWRTKRIEDWITQGGSIDPNVTEELEALFELMDADEQDLVAESVEFVHPEGIYHHERDGNHFALVKDRNAGPGVITTQGPMWRVSAENVRKLLPIRGLGSEDVDGLGSSTEHDSEQD
jgi:hypothetical protein